MWFLDTHGLRIMNMLAKASSSISEIPVAPDHNMQEVDEDLSRII